MSLDKISVFGLGFVGGTTANCMHELGTNVYGVDIDKRKFDKMHKGINCTTDYKLAIKETDVSFVCVETPCKDNGDINMKPLEAVCGQIGEALKEKRFARNHTVVIRSTFFPNKVKGLIDILENESGKKVNEDFGFAINPEFLREAYSYEDFLNPPFIVVGSNTKDTARIVFNCYNKINVPKIHVSTDIAQIIKYVNNSWHALKVAYTNEIGRVCKEYEINGNEVMDLFRKDTKLNISEKYHKIGEPYGGHCLPKDLSVLTHHISEEKCPIIHSISKSNKITND